MRSAISLAFIACIAIPAEAAKPPPPPSGSTTPEIAFVQISGGARRNYTLRLANEDGSGASSIYSSRDIGQMVPHMGSKAARTILLVQGGNVSLVRYKATSVGTALDSIEHLPPIGSSPGAIDVDFAPDGKKYVNFSPLDNSFWIYDIEQRVFWPLIELNAVPHGFAFSRDSSAIIYLDHVSNTEAVLKKVSLSGGAPIELGIRGNYWEVKPAHQSNGFILLRGSDAATSRIEWHPADGSGPYDLAQGYEPSLQCDDSTVIYQKLNSGGSVSLLRVEVASKQGYTTSTSGNYSPDYVGC